MPVSNAAVVEQRPLAPAGPAPVHWTSVGRRMRTCKAITCSIDGWGRQATKSHLNGTDVNDITALRLAGGGGERD